jgi:hypothetical protein
MRKFLGLLGKTFGRKRERTEPERFEVPNQMTLFEAQMHSTFDMDAIWYYERLKWQTRG